MIEKQSVSNNRFILKISLFIAGALWFALFLNTALSILTLNKIYSKSLLSTYTVIGDYYVEKIQRSLKFGKSLDNFVGMDKLLTAMKEENPDIDQIFIYSSEKKYLFSLDQQMPPSAGAIGSKIRFLPKKRF